MTPFKYIKLSCDLDGQGSSDALIGMGRAYELTLVTYRHRNNPNLAQYGMLHPIACRVFCYEDEELSFRNEAIENPFVPDNQKTTYNSKSKIEKELLKLFSNQNYISAQEFYDLFIKIYPYRYGNYRIASLFFNLLNGTIVNQIMPKLKE